MSEYIPKDTGTYTRRAINSAIYRYPAMYVELVDGENDIINGTPEKEVCVKTGTTSDSTAQKAIQLASRKRVELLRKCEAIGCCLAMLTPQYYQVVCLRFWGTKNTEEAIALVRKQQPLRGLPYESAWSPNTVPDKVGYCETQAKRICLAFTIAVGQELGEI